MVFIPVLHRSWLTALVCASSLGLPAAALARPAAPSPVADACRAVLGLEPGQTQFEGCVASLSASADSLAQARAATGARQSCLNRGLKPGTAELAVCAVEGQAHVQPATVQGAPAVAPAKSYFHASNAERRHRERLACAGLGLDPTSSAFEGCVAGLASALFAADNPQN